MIKVLRSKVRLIKVLSCKVRLIKVLSCKVRLIKVLSCKFHLNHVKIMSPVLYVRDQSHQRWLMSSKLKRIYFHVKVQLSYDTNIYCYEGHDLENIDPNQAWFRDHLEPIIVSRPEFEINNICFIYRIYTSETSIPILVSVYT